MRKKIIGIANLDRSSQVFALFERLAVQKDTLLIRSGRLIVKLDTLFKTQDLENRTLFSGTYPYRPNKGMPQRDYTTIKMLEINLVPVVLLIPLQS